MHWDGQVDGQPVTVLSGPDEVVNWMRHQASRLHADRTPLSDPTLTGDRGRAIKAVATAGRSVQFRAHGHMIQAVVRDD